MGCSVSVASTASSSPPEPTRTSPVFGLMQIELMPCWKRFFGPSMRKFFEARSTLSTSPDSDPQNIILSSSAMVTQLNERLFWPSATLVGRTLRLTASKSHTRSEPPPSPPSPPVTRCSSDELYHLTVRHESCAAGLPQMAMPSSHRQTTRLLSSGPPMVARYVPAHEKASAWICTLCSRSVCTSLGGAMPSSEMSHSITGAR